MKIEKGKRYVTRDGDITGPVEQVDDEYYPWAAKVSSFGKTGVFLTWSDDGMYQMEEGHGHDLVEEYTTDPKAAEASVEGLKVGKCYKNRDGEVVKLINCIPESRYPLECKDYNYLPTGEYMGKGVKHPLDLVSPACPLGDCSGGCVREEELPQLPQDDESGYDVYIPALMVSKDGGPGVAVSFEDGIVELRTLHESIAFDLAEWQAIVEAVDYLTEEE